MDDFINVLNYIITIVAIIAFVRLWYKLKEFEINIMGMENERIRYKRWLERKNKEKNEVQ